MRAFLEAINALAVFGALAIIPLACMRLGWEGLWFVPAALVLAIEAGRNLIPTETDTKDPTT